MITRRMEEKFQELKCYFNAKMSEQGEDLTKILNNLLIDPQKEITKQIQIEIKSHCIHLEFINQMLKNQVSQLRRLNISNQNIHEELEQHGRRCLQTNDLPTKTDGSCDDVLESVKSLFKQLKYIFRNQLLIVLIELATDI